MKLRSNFDIEAFAKAGAERLPGMFGLQVVRVAQGELVMRMEIKPQFLAPNGFLHAATVIALADTACGYACVSHIPDGAQSFTTIELKTNFLGTARSGTLEGVARAVHLGRNTQVWDATVTDVTAAKTLALFRCTQMVLWPKS
jgi:1,4-dihydroxy-2-naphthoyl-CoA hydrolase